MLYLTICKDMCLLQLLENLKLLNPKVLWRLRGGDWLLWEKATLKAAGTWDLVEALEGVNVVGSKWVFRAKKDATGKIVCYKARLVVQGFSQIPGVDYFDMFALVA